MNNKMPVGTAITIAVLLASTYMSYAGTTAKTKPAETSAAIAYVNGHAISQQTLDEKIEQLYPTSSVHMKPGGTPELRQKAFDEVILDELIWQQAVKAGHVVPYDRAHRQMLHVRKLCGAADFDAGLAMRGISRLQYTKILRRQMTVDAAKKRHVETPATVTPAETKAFYDENPHRFHRPERVRMRLILVEVATNATKDEEAAAKKKADDLYAKLKAGADFADVASGNSDDEYRFKGGDVGWMHKGSLDPDFEPLAFSLPIGQVAAPFRTPPGYSIMRVEEREPAKELSYEEVRAKLTVQLDMQKKKQLQQAWEAELKKDAEIRVVDPIHNVQAAVLPDKSQYAGTVPSH